MKILVARKGHEADRDGIVAWKKGQASGERTDMDRVLRLSSFMLAK